MLCTRNTSAEVDGRREDGLRSCISCLTEAKARTTRRLLALRIRRKSLFQRNPVDRSGPMKGERSHLRGRTKASFFNQQHHIALHSEGVSAIVCHERKQWKHVIFLSFRTCASEEATVSGDEAIEFEEVGETELTPPETYASNLIEWAVERHASDLFVSDSENSVVVAVRRLGKIETVRRLARAYGRKLQGHLRVMAGADAGEIIRPAEGRGVLTTPSGGLVDLRLSCMPTLFGQDVAVRMFDPVRGARSLLNLGFDDAELQQIRDLIEQPSGLILVAGPVASGKSSTLYAALDALNDGTRKIHTLEDPIEHSISGVMQSQVNLRAGLDFADLLAAVLRHSPDVIMLGEIRDSRTASTAVRAGASGQLVLATIHAKTAAEAVDSMLQYDTKPKFLGSSLLGVINQRLVRQLCPECRKPLDVGELDVSDRIRPRLDGEPAKLYEAVGCDSCFGDGFSNLSCVPEIMACNREISDAISNGAPASELEDVALREGMLSLAEAVAIRIYRGETTPYEGNRVVTDPSLASLAGIAKNVG